MNRPAPAYLADSVPARRGLPLAFAHRGADVGRENSLAAFRAAHEAGFAYLELDVRTTADGELVVFHDETLERVTTGRGRLQDHAWERLEEVTVGGEPLLRFADLLAALPDDGPYVELHPLLAARLGVVDGEPVRAGADEHARVVPAESFTARAFVSRDNDPNRLTTSRRIAPDR